MHGQRVRRVALALSAVLALAMASTSSAQAAAPRTCDGHAATIVGTERADVIHGTPGRDVIVGLGGDDRVEAGAGDDIVCGGRGADHLAGNAGDDRLFGQQDRLTLDRGGASMVGDTLRGGPGDDLLSGGRDRRQRPQEPPAGDTVSYSRSSRPVHVSLAAGTATGPTIGTDTIVPEPRLVVAGSDHDDTLAGSGRADDLVGGAGDDLLFGGAGDDTLTGDPLSGTASRDDDEVHGGAGRDELTADHGRDVLYGNAGPDTLYGDSAQPTRAYGGPGNDSMRLFVTRRAGFVADGGRGRNELDVGMTFPRHRPWVTVDLRRGVASVGDQGSHGRVRRFTEVHLAEDVRWRFVGTDAAEDLTVNFGGPLRAWMHGGDDHVFGSETGGDRIDGGPGDDTVDADGTCTHVEAGSCS